MGSLGSTNDALYCPFVTPYNGIAEIGVGFSMGNVCSFTGRSLENESGGRAFVAHILNYSGTLGTAVFGFSSSLTPQLGSSVTLKMLSTVPDTFYINFYGTDAQQYSLLFNVATQSFDAAVESGFRGDIDVGTELVIGDKKFTPHVQRTDIRTVIAIIHGLMVDQL